MKNVCWLFWIMIVVGCTSDDKAMKPNLLVIMADSLSYSDIGVYGQDSVSATPHIDRLAQEGVCFTNGYSISSTPVSGQYALMTGRCPWKEETGTGGEVLTLPEMMKKVGYVTAAVGNWHSKGEQRGVCLKSGESAKGMGFDYSSEEIEGYKAGQSVYEVMNFIEQQKKTSFFLYYGLGGESVSGLHVDIDKYIGMLLSGLADKELLDKTMIVFSSYRSAADENNHIPFFVYWKGKISPVVSDALVSPMDLLASLGKLVGVSVPEGLDSHESVNAFMGKSLETREELVMEVHGEMKKISAGQNDRT